MKLFLRIFLSFWLSTVAMIMAVAVAGDLLPFTTSQDRAKKIVPDRVASHLTDAVNTYERQGLAAFLSQLNVSHAVHPHSVYLVDENNKQLVRTGTDEKTTAELAQDVRNGGHAEVLRVGSRVFVACPIISATGRRYVAVVETSEAKFRPTNMRFWFDVAIAMLATSIVCMGLALYLTRPITTLRRAARLLADGDLSARATRARRFRRDELGDLARDFDMMASRIQLLMTAQRRFVTDVSHELGAPLTRLHLALELHRWQLNERSSAELDRIERETQKLSNLVQQLLLLAGLEAGSWPGEALSPISTRMFCEELMEDADFEAKHADCQVVGDQEDVSIMVYPSLLRRAIDNVLRNAIRYAPSGTEVRLDCKVEKDLQRVVFEVSDRGPGVPESMLNDIFQPFFRTDPGRESDTGRTGLGLAIASEAIRLHDGTITANNRRNGGLLVIIALPLRIPVCEDHSGSSFIE